MSKPASSSKIVIWGGYLALTFLLGLVLSVLSVRGGLWQQGLLMYALCCVGAAGLLALFAVCTALPGFSSQRRDLMIRSLAVLPGSLLFLTLLMTRGDYPVIHDISTDLVNPPVFTQALLIRGKSANSLDINAETLQLQQGAYPDIVTIQSKLNAVEAFARASDLAEEMGWEITHSDPAAGMIEAVATTTVMAFKDDIVIRLQSEGSGTDIDLRSASRVGRSDLGANAKRIREFMRRFKA